MDVRMTSRGSEPPGWTCSVTSRGLLFSRTTRRDTTTVVLNGFLSQLEDDGLIDNHDGCALTWHNFYEAIGSPSYSDLSAAAQKLKGVGEVQQTPYLVRCRLRGEASIELTLFVDGRLIVHGTTDRDGARSLYARYVGA